MPFSQSDYKANKGHIGRHLQTIIPYFFYKDGVLVFERERVELEDGDFLDLDWIKNNNSKCIVLTHGLEGSSKSQYVQTCAKYFSGKSWDVLAWNNRGCSDEVNRLKTFYHSGKTDDLEFILESRTNHYKDVILIGFSMGGNITLKLLGDKLAPENVKKAACVSVPVDLADSAIELKKWQQKIYMDNFLKTLKKKILHKSQLHSYDELDMKKVLGSKNFHDFDEHVTARLFGYQSAEDYWERASSLSVLGNIEVPTLLLNSSNDPFLGKNCHPLDASKKSESLHFELASAGAHIGYNFYGQNHLWLEQRIERFIGPF